MPFGEELFADGQSRTTCGKYSQTGQDSVRKRFTGYEKDVETGLDFAEARMYNNQHARFTAVDPLLASGKSANPQTFNRCVYVLNNPLILTDPRGLQVATYSGDVWANENETTFYGKKGEGRHQFKKSITRDGFDGFRYAVDSKGWRSIGKTADLIEDDISDWASAAIAIKRMANSMFKMPITAAGAPSNPFGPSISSITGLQPFGDDETKTATWRDEIIATGTELGLTTITTAGVAESAAVEGATSRSLPILNPHFNPDPIAVGRNFTNFAAAQLAENSALAQSVLSKAEYLAGQNSPAVARMQWGNAVERLFWRNVNNQQHIGQNLFQRLGGPGRADGLCRWKSF